MAIIGGWCYDESHGNGEEAGSGYAWAGLGIISPEAADSGPHSRGGWDFTLGDGGNHQADFWDSPVSGKVWYYFPFDGQSHANVASTEYEAMYFHYLSTVATGKIRLLWIYNTATTGHFRIEYYNGTAWTAATGGNGAVRNIAAIWYCRVEIDITATTGRTVVVQVDGSTDINATTGTTDLIAGTAMPIDGQVKGTGALNYKIWECLANDTNTTGGHSTAKTYTSASSDVHCFGNYPVSDVGGAYINWTTKDCGVHSRLRWTALDTPEDDDFHTDDRIESRAAAAEYLAEISDQTHASADVYAVAFFIENPVGAGGRGANPTHILVSVPSEDSGVPTAYTGNQTGGLNEGRYLFLAQTPGSADWTKALFNEIRVGVRGDDGDTCFTVFVMPIGINLERPTAAIAQAGPASVALGSANPMII